MGTIDIEALKAEVKEFRNAEYVSYGKKNEVSDYQKLVCAAEEILEKYPTHEGDDKEVYEVLASFCASTGFKLFMHSGFFRKGAEFYRKAIDLSPDSYQIHWGYYTAIEEIVENKDYATPELIQDAIMCLTFCIDYCTTPELKKEKHTHFRYFELARVYLAANEIEKAIECAKKSLELGGELDFEERVRNFIEECEKRMKRDTKIPDKLPYTKCEKIAEIASGALAAVMAAVIVALMVMGKTGGENIILLVCFLIAYSIFTLCSIYPQHTNLFSKPEKISEKGFRKARVGCIISKIVLMSVIFFLSLPIFS